MVITWANLKHLHNWIDREQSQTKQSNMKIEWKTQRLVKVQLKNYPEHNHKQSIILNLILPLRLQLLI